MATTSPDNIRTPNPTDNFNLVADLATTASDVQSALNTRANAYKGTAAQRTSFTSTAVPGVLWQDTDGAGMLWKRGVSTWEPAVGRWRGTTTQMNAIAAPDGFEWYNTTDQSEYLRVGGAWSGGSVNIAPASGFSGTIKASIVNREVEIVFAVTGVVPTTGHVTLGTAPVSIRPPSDRRTGTVWVGGSRYGAVAILSTGLIAIANLSTLAGDQVTGSVMYRL